MQQLALSGTNGVQIYVKSTNGAYATISSGFLFSLAAGDHIEECGTYETA